MAGKPHLNLIFVGHVDHGKSTVLGKFLIDSGAISQQELEKIKKEVQALGKETFEFAWVLDVTSEERTKGVTIELTHREFETQKYYFTVIDAPGHRDFVKNMITGASQADAAVLVVDVTQGVQAQTKEHVYLCKIMGIKQMIVAINKMDLVNYDEAKYNEVKKQVEALLKGIGYNPAEINFVPVSGKVGDNLVSRSDKMPWYKGPTLMQALDSLKEPEKPINLPLRLPIQDVYSITGVGVVPVGEVKSGVLKVGDHVVIEPAHVEGDVKSIEMHHKPLQQAVPGDNIGFNIKGVAKNQIKRGDVVGHPDNPPTVAKEFTVQLLVINHPTVITEGYTPVFHAHTAQVACRFAKLLKKLDPKTGQVVEENPQFLKNGDIAIVKVVPTKPMVVEAKNVIPPLSRVAVRDMGRTIGAGIVIEVVPKEK